MNREELKQICLEGESHAFSGWDFSYLDGRYVVESLPWDYREKVLDFLKPDTRLLDMGTGGGEFLLSLRHPYALTSATEGWEPNLQLCRKRLSPLGIQVESYTSDEDTAMPFPDGTFDLVLDRHESYDIAEVRRVLKPGGFFLTQQVGGQNGRALGKRLLPGLERPGINFNLENELPKFQQAGFRIMYRNQAYPVGRFLDLGVLCFHAKVISWEFPGFTVDSCFDRLLGLQRELEERGCIPNQEHRFLLIAKKR